MERVSLWSPLPPPLPSNPTEESSICQWSELTYQQTIPGGQIKRGQCTFFRRSKARFKEFWQSVASEITVHICTLRNKKLSTFHQRALQKVMIFSVCTLAVLLTHYFYIKTILLTTFMVKKLSTFASIYLLASIMYCDIFGGNSYLFLL